MSADGFVLDGLRVLDMSRVLAGPYVGRMLADLGADVVKVEPPEGDVTRNWGKVVAGLSGYYTQQNVGKRNLCVDLRAEGGPELVRQLAQKADVLVENFRPGVLAQFDLDYASLTKLNPRLVMCSISGFGQQGPEARRPAYAAVLHAESGIVQRQAQLDGTRPEDPRVSFADMNAALHGLVGLLSALWMRERTGVGQQVDIGMLDSMLATDDYVHLALDGVPLEEGIILNETWDAAGGPFILAGDFRWVWRKLNEVHGVKDPTPKGADLATKIRCRREAVQGFFSGLADRAALSAALDRAGLAWGDVRTTEAALQSPSVPARGIVAELDDRAGGTRRVVQSPYRFSSARSGASCGAAYRGEHNAAVLEDWLEMDSAGVEALAGASVLLREEPPTG